MLRSATKIIGHRLHAADGEIGRSVDFLLEEQSWALSYLVVEAGRWLEGQRILISTLALSKSEWTSRRLVMEGTRQQVKTAPRLDQGGPVSRQHELELSRHYGWSAPGPTPLEALPLEAMLFDASAAEGAPPLPEMLAAPMSEGHLKSVKDLLGFSLEASDGTVGHVDDVIVDDDTWTLPYLVVDSRNWLSGRKVLVPTEWVGRIDRQDHRVEVLMSANNVEEEPEYDPSAPVYHRRVEPAPVELRDSGRFPARSWSFPAPEAWGTRGLRAALARIIHG